MTISGLPHCAPPIVSIVNAGAAEIPSCECVAERTIRDACARL
jgi:hypothetical protein